VAAFIQQNGKSAHGFGANQPRDALFNLKKYVFLTTLDEILVDANS
jgi:hypothetical protein